jgi:4-hydroxythreonine-4-phosphate dehydrogenase
LKPRIAVTLGDPAGIGPEVALGAAGEEEVLSACVPILVGPRRALERAAEILGLEGDLPRPLGGTLPRQGIWMASMDEEIPPLGKVTPEGGRAAGRAVEEAVGLVRSGVCKGIATAPLHKEALRLAGYQETGHTGLLARLTGSENLAMLFRSPRLSVLLLTDHLPLSEALGALTWERIVSRVLLAAGFWELAVEEPLRVAVAGVNPHAGEEGLLGPEEAEIIAPAVEELRRRGVDASGPHPPDTVYHRAASGEFDLVASPFHDQGLVALKTLAFGESVHVTLGLPFIRTSVDHGTAFGLAGSGRADAAPMRRAILEAASLATRHVGNGS